MELSDERIELRPWREHARAFVRGEVGLGEQQFAVCEHGAVRGAIGMNVYGGGIGRIGYWCAPEARRRGITTSALRQLSRHALGMLGLERLELIADPDNHASQRVAERVGFRREGVLRSHREQPDGQRRDSILFSLLPGELL